MIQSFSSLSLLAVVLVSHSAHAANTIDTGGRKANLTTANGAFIRAGSSTQASVNDAGNQIMLSKGILLASAKPGGLIRSGVTLDAAGVSSKVRGTMLVAYQPGKFVKIACIEGAVRVRLRSLFAEAVSLHAGQMLIVNPTDKELPEPVDIDLQLLMDTSTLIGGDAGGLPDAVLQSIMAAIAEQQILIQKGKEVLSPLVMPGAGLQLILANQNGVERLRSQINQKATTVKPVIPVKSGPGFLKPSTPSPPNPFTINESTLYSANRVTTPGVGSISARQISPSIWSADAASSQALLFTGHPTVPDFLTGISFYEINAHDADITVQADLQGPGNNKALVLASAGANLSVAGSGNGITNNGPINLFADGQTTISQNAQIQGTDILLEGFNSTISNSTITGETVDIRVLSAGAVPGGTLTVDHSTVTASKPNTTLQVSAENTGNIVIQNSSQLLALAGSILISNAGAGSLTVSNSTLQASGSGNQIIIDINDNVSFINATMIADTIKARTRNGPELFIQGGTFNATTLIKLYAEANNATMGNPGTTLHFAGTVNLNTPQAILAGNQVLVDTGGNVNVSGAATVYANQHNYNTGSFGHINAAPLTQVTPFTSKPTF